MLDALRRGSTGWVAKILFALLVLSFMVWGVADVFTGFGRGAIAKVGSHDIRAEDFQRAFQNEIAVISRQSGQRITAEQARQAGLDQRVLNQLMAWAAVESHATDLNLALSDEKLADSIKNDPSFKGPDGRFSRIQFENIINQIGVSEAGFMKLRRRDDLREQVTSALINGVAVPDAMVGLMNAWREEKRVAEFFNINQDKITVPPPDDAKLKQVYEANPADFVVPEMRKLAILLLSIDALKGKMDVTEQEIATKYEDTKNDYNIPERRRIQQIAFKDKAAAEAAKASIKGGKTFGEIATGLGAKTTDIDLGLISKDKMIDTKIADAAFALPKDTVSDVVEGRFATVLLNVTDIQPAITKTLNDVKSDVKDKIAREKAQAKLQEMLDQVEDHRAAGKNLKDIANEMKLEFVEIPATDSFNKTPDDKMASNLPDAINLVRTAFQGQVGIETEAVELGDGGFGWVDVLEVTPQKQKPFDQVKEDVRKLAITKERDRLVTELATKLVERADAGTSMADLAKEAGAAKVETSQPVTRATDAHGLSKDAVARIFTLAKGKSGSAATADRKSRTVFKVTEITPAAEPTKEQREKIARELKEQITDEVLTEYVIALQNRLGTHINEQEFKRATGAEVPQ